MIGRSTDVPIKVVYGAMLKILHVSVPKNIRKVCCVSKSGWFQCSVLENSWKMICVAGKCFWEVCQNIDYDCYAINTFPIVSLWGFIDKSGPDDGHTEEGELCSLSHVPIPDLRVILSSHRGQGRSLKSTGPPSPASASRRLMMTAMAASSLLGLLEPGSSMMSPMLMWEFSPAGEKKTNKKMSRNRKTAGNFRGKKIFRHTYFCTFSFLLKHNI